MAQQDVNNILSTFQNLLAYRQGQQRMAQEKELQENQQQIEKDRNKELSRQFDQQYKLAEKRQAIEEEQASLNRQLLAQKVSENILNGIPVAGDTITPGVLGGPPNAQGQPTPVSMIHNIPGIGELTLPTHEAFMRQQQADKATMMQPEIDAKAAEALAARRAQEESDALRLAKEHENRMAELKQENDYRLQQQKNMLDAEMARMNLENAAQFRRTQFEVTGGLSEIPGNPFNQFGGVHIVTGPGGAPQVNTTSGGDIIGNTLKGIGDGSITMNQLRTLYPRQASAFEMMASQHGLMPLNDKEAEQLAALEKVAKIVPTLQEMYLIRHDHPMQDLNPLSTAGQRFNMLADIVKGNLPAISMALSGVKRFNNYEMKNYEDYLIPKRGPTSNKNMETSKYNSFVTHDLQEAFDTATRRLPKGQRDIIRDKLGLNGFPMLGSAVNTPGQSPGTPQGATPALPLGQRQKPGQGDVHWVIQNGKLVPMTAGGVQ